MGSEMCIRDRFNTGSWAICGSDDVPLSTAKIKINFNTELLRQIHAVENILCNMVLFHCRTCNTRFPTFHPDAELQPNFKLQCTAACPIDVATWDAPPSEDDSRWKRNQHMAPLHHGQCARCAAQLQRPRKEDEPPNIAIFSAENRHDPLYPLFGKDHGAYLATLRHMMHAMTAPESMLIALSHMQVSVCHLQPRRTKHPGLTAFRKNIISLPQ